MLPISCSLHKTADTCYYTNHQDQINELEKLGISAVYFGSAQINPSAESKALCAESDALVVLLSP